MEEICTNDGDHGIGRCVSSRALLAKGYSVHGIKWRTSLFDTDRIDHLYHDLCEKGATSRSITAT